MPRSLARTRRPIALIVAASLLTLTGWFADPTPAAAARCRHWANQPVLQDPWEPWADVQVVGVAGVNSCGGRSYLAYMIDWPSPDQFRIVRSQSGIIPPGTNLVVQMHAHCIYDPDANHTYFMAISDGSGDVGVGSAGLVTPYYCP